MSNSDGSNLIGIAFIFYSLLIYSTLRVRVNPRLRLTPNPEQAQIIVIYAIQCFTFPSLDTFDESEYPMCIYNILTYIFAQLSYRGSQPMN